MQATVHGAIAAAHARWSDGDRQVPFREFLHLVMSGMAGSAADYHERWASPDANAIKDTARASIDRRVELEVALKTVA